MSRELKPCGTPAAYKRHVQRGERPCDACRAANSAHASAWNDKNYARYRESQAARNRAIRRLIAMHPVEYRALVDEERSR